MMELLSVASLSIAIKFGETGPPSLHEMQEGLEYCFEAKLIQRMELKTTESLGWELNCITPHSCVELIMWELNSVIKPYVLDQLTSRLNDDLLASTLGSGVIVSQIDYNLDEMVRTVSCCAVCVHHSACRRPKMSQVVGALDGNISLSDLNEGIRPRHSSVYNSHGSTYKTYMSLLVVVSMDWPDVTKYSGSVSAQRH